MASSGCGWTPTGTSDRPRNGPPLLCFFPAWEGFALVNGAVFRFSNNGRHLQSYYTVAAGTRKVFRRGAREIGGGESLIGRRFRPGGRSGRSVRPGPGGRSPGRRSPCWSRQPARGPGLLLDRTARPGPRDCAGRARVLTAALGERSLDARDNRGKAVLTRRPVAGRRRLGSRACG